MKKDGMQGFSEFIVELYGKGDLKGIKDFHRKRADAHLNMAARAHQRMDGAGDTGSAVVHRDRRDAEQTRAYSHREKFTRAQGLVQRMKDRRGAPWKKKGK